MADEEQTNDRDDGTEPEVGPRTTSRRRVLGSLGIGAAAAGLGVLHPSSADAQDQPPGPGGRDGRDRRGGDGDRGRRGGRGGAGRGEPGFGRMFPGEPFAEPSAELREALTIIGAPGGMLDAHDPLDEGPIRLITEPELSENNPDNPTHTAGLTFVGQFLDHDITFDANSRLGRPTPLRRSTNLRTAAFDLDSVYGGGPVDDPTLYEENRPGALRVESGGQFEDLPRDEEEVAIIADPRNDENLMIAGLQAAMLKFHNAALGVAQVAGLDDQAAFDQARRMVVWHWQWLILHEFLPAFVGKSTVDDVLANGRRFYTPDEALIPVEFQSSAYRFGHSMVRPSYRANLAGDDGDPFFGFVFDPSQFGTHDPDDLNGGSRAPRRFIGWQTFFDFDDGEVKNNKKLRTTISTPLFQLPIAAIASPPGEDVGPTSLATRNLLRHITWEVASGQRVAAEMDVERLTPGDLSDFGDVLGSLATSTPLWLYILREADLTADGEHLGPVGARIVAEVFIGLLKLDDQSYLAAEPDWTPVLPILDEDAGFRMVDLLTVAGVDPITRGQ